MSTLAPDRGTAAGTISRYSVVRRVQVGPGGCSLTLESPARALTPLDVACAPDAEAAGRLRGPGRRPLALRLDVSGCEGSGDGEVTRCSALFTSPTGPERQAVPLAAALALCADGLRTVVTRG